MSLDEPLFEPIARYWRLSIGIKEIEKNNPIIVVDLGCGPKKRFYDFAKKRKVIFKKYIGIDQLINHTIKDTVSLSDNFADYVVAFAFVEHIENPKKIMNEAIRIVKKGGKVIITTPSPRAKPLLELLAALNLISHREIREHKQYFDKKSLINLIYPENKKKIGIFHHYFHPWQNNLLILKKK
jgi:SAM-dependent methyltransferase